MAPPMPMPMPEPEPEPVAGPRVRYFAAAAQASGCDEEQVPAQTVGELRELLAVRYGPPMERVLRSGSFLVDGVATRDPDRPLGRLVDVLPPFSGG